MLRPNARSPSITSQESYSAVMITDLIAYVNVNPELGGSPKSTKEETNLAFESDGSVKSSLQDADSTKKNGTGISKGVILNAVQFSSSDSKKNIDEKPVQLTASLAVPTLTQPISEPKGFKDMTLMRKIAFIFSFLPSIFFVLCFAVILPCKVPKPCVDEAWIVTFNNTEPLSRLHLADKILLTAFKEGENVLLELEKNDGNSTYIELPSSPAYLKCGKIMDEKKIDCIVMDVSGKVFTFNSTHCKNLWNVSETENLPSSPVIISQCSDKLDDIAVAVSNTNIKILHGGNIVSNFEVTHCDSIPVKLTEWKTESSSNIVFVCDKDGEDKLVKVPKSVWCPIPEKSPEKKQEKVLETGALDSLKNSIIKPLENNNLLLWFGNEVLMIQPNGTHVWTVSNVSLPEENRFVLHGNFLDDNKYLAFIGSNLTSGLQVTILKPADGSFVKEFSIQNTEALEIIHITGKKRDYALLLRRKVAFDTLTTAFTRISDISSTIVSILSNEKLNDNTTNPTDEGLAILDMDGNLDIVKEISSGKDSTFKSSMTANTDEHGILHVYLLTMLHNSHIKTTEVMNINIANWDKSSKSKCLAKP